MRASNLLDARDGLGEFRKSVYLLLLLSLLLQLNLMMGHFWFAPGPPFLETDSIDYLALADRLAAGQAYTAAGHPELYRVPGYPAFLAIFRFVFPGRLWPVILAQIGLNLLLLPLTWHLAMSLFHDRRLAFTAMLIQAVSGISMIYAMKILSETLFVFFLFLALVLVESAGPEQGKPSRPGLLRLAGAGFTTGAACLVRAIAVPLIPLLVFYVLWRFRKFTAVAAFVLPVVLLCGLWTWRNASTAGYYGLATVSDFNLYRYNAAALEAKRKGITLEEQKNLIDRELAAIPDETARARHAKRQAMRIIRHAPLSYLVLHVKGDLIGLLPAGGSFLRLFGLEVIGQGKQGEFLAGGLWAGIWSSFRRHSGLLLVMVPGLLFLLVKYACSAVGLLASLTAAGKPDWRLLFYALVLLYLLGIPGPASYSRFRVPAEPLLALFAAVGLWRLIPVFRKTAPPPAVP